MTKQSPLHKIHQQLGAKFTEFAGFEMPIQYASIKEEHLAVRKTVGLFDVSHMVVVDLKGAEVLGSITSLDKDYPIMTSNKFGKGKAIYVGLPAKGEVLGALLDDLIDELGIKKGPDVPSGVMARQIDKTHFLYVNVSGEPKEIRMKEKSRSILFDKDYSDGFTIAPYEPEFIEIN